MKEETLALLNKLNKAIIKCRGIYSAWSKKYNISYNEMLVYYTIREYGYCTQKMICDSYLLPRQTMNHVFALLQDKGILVQSEFYSRGKEKAFVLSEEGKAYGTPLIDSITQLEQEAVGRMGQDKVQEMADLVLEYDRILNEILDGKSEQK